MLLEASSHDYAWVPALLSATPVNIHLLTSQIPVLLTSLTHFPVLVKLGVVIFPKVMGRGDD